MTYRRTTARRPLYVRLNEKIKRVADADACWLWCGATNNHGYGVIGSGKGKGLLLAHRVAWQQEYGPIPDDVKVLHTCDNPPCCNPRHLFLGTQADNMQDKERKGRGNHAIGRRNARTKLTNRQIQWIRESTLSCAEVGRRLGISASYASAIRAGKRR